MLSVSKTLTVLALASFGAAQISGISSQCTQTFLAAASNSDLNACLTPSPLLSVLTSGNSSIVGPIDNWLKSLCAAPACSNSTISAFFTNITTGCSAEAATLGIKTGDVAGVSQLAEQFYPSIRQVVCLKDGNTNCVTQTLTNIETYTGPLTLTNIGGILGGSVANLSVPSNVTCTNCIKAAYNIVNKLDSTFLSSESLKETCGNSFVDGNNPEGVVQSASTSTQGSSTAGSNSGSLGLGLGLGLNGASAFSTVLFAFTGLAFLA